jgi:hypothetical protein
MQFQATCSKWNKKLTLTLNASDIDSARNALHSQWYSIIEINETSSWTTNDGNFFYFDAKVNWLLQSGKIQSTDIFKSYKKLTEDLKYDIIYIYTNEGMPEESKKLITAKVKDGYRLYRESMGEDVDLEDELRWKTQDQQDMQEISWEVLKEIAKFGTVIDSSIEKIQNLFLKYHQTITPEQRINLENLENSLIQTKWTKNLWKMRNTVENWLRSIWEIELSLLKIGMTEEKKQFLEETNALLKQVGSKDRIESKEEKENSLEFKINNLFTRTTKTVAPVAEKKEKKDTNSFIYFKNKRELDIYKKKLSSIEIEILKSVFSFQFSQLKKLLLKRKLVSQNIEIIDNRINNRIISYTQMIHGMEYYVKSIFSIIDMITNIFFYTMYVYTISFIILHILDIMNILPSHFDGKSILFITILTISATLLSYIRWIKGAILVLPILLFSIYFLSINF